jgi:phosphoglycolate phosphatase-like HAD superfamily hydrolase
MKRRVRPVTWLVGALLATAAITAARAQAPDPLPSWNDGASKQAIVAFVARVTTPGPDFVAPSARIAVFDNDGTLWPEQPTYTQFQFALDRVRALARRYPEWRATEPFKSVLEDKPEAVLTAGEQSIADLLAVTHTGMSTEEYSAIVTDWIGSAQHPTLKRPYTDLVYQPMLEVLAYLRDNDFKTFIVSGGGVEFLRPWTERVYGVPPEQVVGSRSKLKYEMRDGMPVLMKVAELDLVDDKAGKPVGIQQQIGRRPLMAFGNSDGDFEMLEWTTSGPGPRFGLIVHHTDATREWAYDRGSPVGALARGLDEAAARGWVLADMQNDWKVIYPFQRAQESEAEQPAPAPAPSP